ncbi:hypothetical protein HMPREF9418_1599 [Neisseria macacae ATCC 33926]|uniref:Uncharacterized protein n=1 Tax=Neisseria macacae ATCC 33926 TaxID=997348 RepID=A0AA36XKC4_9NEIS|nr:hypothetical protein HMPREF9418_1599 [Neisseria macacae ATCC 33926]
MQTDVDVKQTYSRFHRDSGIAIGIIAIDILSAAIIGRLKCNKATFSFSSSFGEYS